MQNYSFKFKNWSNYSLIFLSGIWLCSLFKIIIRKTKIALKIYSVSKTMLKEQQKKSSAT